MKALITGGAGFIGSHMAEALLGGGHKVSVIDDLSTGAMDNIAHLKSDPGFDYVIDTILNAPLLAELVDRADVVFHLAAAVGVRLIVDSPVRTISTNIGGNRGGPGPGGQKRQEGDPGLHLRGLRQGQQGALLRRRRPGHGPHHQGPLVLRRLQGRGRVSGLGLLQGEGTARGGGPAVQHRGPQADRPLRHGPAHLSSARPWPESP